MSRRVIDGVEYLIIRRIAEDGDYCSGCAFRHIACPPVEKDGKDCVGWPENRVFVKSTPETRALLFAQKATDG